MQPSFVASLAELPLQAGHQGTLGQQGCMGGLVKGAEAVAGEDNVKRCQLVQQRDPRLRPTPWANSRWRRQKGGEAEEQGHRTSGRT